MVDYVTLDETGLKVLLMGNEAIARGAVEAGVQMVTGYPGTPSSEITEALLRVAKQLGIYAEWSVNEKVAVESAAGGAVAGLRSLVTMKHAGLNWVLDFLSIASYQEFGGLVIVAADDPGSHSSGNEQDSRILSQFCHLPTFSPSSAQEAKDMVNFAFDISEKHGVPALLRSTTYLSHGKGIITLGEIPKKYRVPVIDHTKTNIIFPVVERHRRLHNKLNIIKDVFENSAFNTMEGPLEGKLLIITTGMGYLYCKDILRMLDLTRDVGVLKIGTIFPLPEETIKTYLSTFENVLFVEEVEPYLEENIEIISLDMKRKKIPKFYGKRTQSFPQINELKPEDILTNVSSIMGSEVKHPVTAKYKDELSVFSEGLPQRGLTLCAGCPHRATFYIAKQALKKAKKGYCLGDIGCYSLGALPPFSLLKSFQGMGSGPGVASGLGNLNLDEPIIAFIGDSTFFHACIPAIVNMVHTNSKVTLVVMDNFVTGSTGFQPHPGTESSGLDETATKLDIKQVLEGLGVRNIFTIDPFVDQKKSIEIFLKCFRTSALSVIISRRKCAIVEQKEKRVLDQVSPHYCVDPHKCVGCKVCLKDFGCPAMVWDSDSEKVFISEELCVGCGACVSVCPTDAIKIV